MTVVVTIAYLEPGVAVVTLLLLLLLLLVSLLLLVEHERVEEDHVL
jgi:hypothetical protein